jgi:ribose 5-phosphate isomerase B
MAIVIGCDEAAFDLKEVIKAYLIELGEEVEDMGVYDKTPVLYPDIALKVATAVADGRFERGILMCGTGLGMAITANKVPGIRAATCHDVYSAERSRKSNNCQILTMGGRVVGPEVAKTVVRAWLASEFQGGGSAPKVQRMIEIDEMYHRVRDVNQESTSCSD